MIRRLTLVALAFIGCGVSDIDLVGTRCNRDGGCGPVLVCDRTDRCGPRAADAGR